MTVYISVQQFNVIKKIQDTFKSKQVNLLLIFSWFLSGKHKSVQAKKA